MARRMFTCIGLAVGLLAATPVEAHVFGAEGAGLLDGLGHPLSGWDHILAMVAVGLWASQNRRPARWALPAAFLAAMAAGGMLGWLGVPVPAVEGGIALSVLALGLAIGLAVRPALWAGLPLVALFAIFHGHAHGAELPAAASPLLYGLGFVVATAVLHGIGLGLGGLASRRPGRFALRVGGAATALAGLLLLVG